MNNIAQKTTDVQMAGTISCFMSYYSAPNVIKLMHTADLELFESITLQ